MSPNCPPSPSPSPFTGNKWLLWSVKWTAVWLTTHTNYCSPCTHSTHCLSNSCWLNTSPPSTVPHCAAHVLYGCCYVHYYIVCPWLPCTVVISDTGHPWGTPEAALAGVGVSLQPRHVALTVSISTQSAVPTGWQDRLWLVG